MNWAGRGVGRGDGERVERDTKSQSITGSKFKCFFLRSWIRGSRSSLFPL